MGAERAVCIPFAHGSYRTYNKLAQCKSSRAWNITNSWSDMGVGNWRRRLQPIVAALSSFHSGTDGRGESGTQVVG